MTLSTTSTSDYSTVTNASQQLTAMVAGQRYRFVSTTACYIAIGSNPTASAADNNHLVPAGVELEIVALTAAKVAVIRVAADGACTLSIVS